MYCWQGGEGQRRKGGEAVVAEVQQPQLAEAREAGVWCWHFNAEQAGPKPQTLDPISKPPKPQPPTPNHEPDWEIYQLIVAQMQTRD